VSHGSRLTGFAWSKVTSVGVVLNAFDSKVIYPFNRKRVPEYLFAISGTSETITSMEKAPPNMAMICISSTSVTNLQSVLPVSTEPPLSTLSSTLPSTTSL
jgi:hypothetical protein